LIPAFVLVVLLFVLTIGYAQYIERTLDTAAHTIAQNAAPSIALLADARTDVRDLELLVAEHLFERAAGQPGERVAVEEAQRRLRGSLERYYALRPFGGEEQMWQQHREEFRELDARVTELLRMAENQSAAAGQRPLYSALRPIADQFDDTTRRLIELNATHAQSLALSIEDTRLRSWRVEMLLTIASVLVAVGTALIAWLLTRRYDALLEDHRRVAEQRANELEQFAGRVAHDIRNPLTAVGLALQQAGRRTGGDPLAQTAIESGRASLARVLRLVDDLLDFARAGAPPTTSARAEVREVLDDLLPELMPGVQSADATLHIEPFAPVAVACAPGVLTSLLSNLLRNAIKYIVDSPERRITVRVLERSAFVRVEVEDTGPGVPPGLETAIFQPYVRAPGLRQAGVGLGLATVKRMSEAHGGAAGYRRASRQGSVFWFELPKSAAPAPETAPSPPLRPRPA
jgi:signal transduction histidine kinase